MTTENTQDLAAAENLKNQIEQFTNYSGELVGGGSIKKITEELKAKSADLWQVPPEEIMVIPGYNPRTHNAAYYAGIADLGGNMAKTGYMKDKPLAVYLTKIDGKDRMVLQDGHRRHAAVLYAKSTLGADIKTVPIVVKDKSLNQLDLLKDMLHANDHAAFSMYEKAVIAKRFKSYNWTPQQIAEEMGCTTAFVGQLLDLAGAPAAIQQLVESDSMAATAAIDIVKKFGEDAVSVATEAVAAAKKAGKKKATMKDVVTPKDQKTKNAKKVSYELYFNLKKLREDPAIEKKLDDKQIEVIDALLAKVEHVRKPKPEAAPKPIKVKPAPAAKKTATKKAAPAAKKTANPKQAKTEAEWAKAVAAK